MGCSFITRVFSREIKIYKPNDGNYLVHCWMLHLHLQTEIQPLFRMSEKEWFSLTELRNVIKRIQYLCVFDILVVRNFYGSRFWKDKVIECSGEFLSLRASVDRVKLWEMFTVISIAGSTTSSYFDSLSI